jgi:ankyrin repeat protein
MQANLSQVDNEGFSALHWAVMKGEISVAYKLLSQGIDRNLKVTNKFFLLIEKERKRRNSRRNR